MYTLFRKSIRILVLLTAVCLCFTSCDEDKKESSSAAETKTSKTDSMGITENTDVIALDSITVTYESEDSSEQWEISDPETIEKNDVWLTEFDSTHTSEKEPSGEYVFTERYTFNYGKPIVRIGYYDNTALIVGKKYYTGTGLTSIQGLIKLIRIQPLSISVNNHGDKYTISDADTISQITGLVDEITQTCEQTDFDYFGGGNPFELKYSYKGESQKVVLGGDIMTVEYNYSDRNNKRSEAFKLPQESYEKLQALVNRT